MSSLALLLLLAPVNAWADEPVTYTEHIAPILWKHCAACHRPGEIAPFSLLSYKDAAKRANFIASITADRTMPPWKPEPGHGDFSGARRLSNAEIDLLARWAKTGAAEGDPKHLPPAPKFTEGWQLGQPDLVLKMPESFKVPAGGADIYQCFVIPIPLDRDRTVSAVEFRPGNTRVVHHALLFLDSTGAARKKAEAEKGPGFRSFGGPGVTVTGMLGGWVPGQVPQHFPEGIGLSLKKGSDLVLQIHYHPSGKAETDQSQLGIYFNKKPAEKLIAPLVLRTRDIDIPPGEKRYQRTVTTPPIPVDVYAVGISPHMHYLGREMKAWAELPGGKTERLIWIKDWDFNWQGSYLFAKPVRLPKGTILKLEAYYDNSADNPFNPSNPPKRVRFGEETTDEMCLCPVTVYTDRREDSAALMKWQGLGLGSDLETAGAMAAASIPTDKLVPPGGVPIPERYKAVLQQFDVDGDGKLTVAEIDAMPVLVRNKVKAAIKQYRDKQADPPKK